VGKRKLESAIRIFKDLPENTFQFKVQWWPFFLNPSLPKEGVDKMESYTKKFGAERVKMMVQKMKEVGLNVGINFSYGGKIGNTMDSHRLITWAAQFGDEKQNDLVEELFKNYFEEEKNIADLRVLEAAAQKVGIEGSKSFLLSGEKEVEVQQLIQKNQIVRKISGVPHFIINSRFQLSGAQDTQVFCDLFEQIAEENQRDSKRKSN